MTSFDNQNLFLEYSRRIANLWENGYVEKITFSFQESLTIIHKISLILKGYDYSVCLSESEGLLIQQSIKKTKTKLYSVMYKTRKHLLLFCLLCIIHETQEQNLNRHLDIDTETL